MTELTYTTVDRIFSKFNRDLKGTELNESDVIEWIGEALDFLKVESIQEQAIAFLEVNNYHSIVPKGFQMVLQVARNNKWVEDNKNICSPCSIINEIHQEDTECHECNNDCFNDVVITDCNGFILEEGEIVDYRPYFDLKFDYPYWTNNHYYKDNFTPIRLSNHTLFNSIVCKEKVDHCIGMCNDEYTIVGTTEKRLRFSFEKGQVALAYLKTATDETTGYPLIPDEVSYITAITYYIKWKIAEWYAWNGRQGFQSQADKAQERWEHYARQAKNKAKMPKSIDDYQDLLEQTHYLIPNHRKYYSFFGNLNKEENLRFKNNTSYGYKQY